MRFGDGLGHFAGDFLGSDAAFLVLIAQDDPHHPRKRRQADLLAQLQLRRGKPT